MKIQVSSEQYEEIQKGLQNHLLSSKQWDPDEGMLFIECGEDMIVADVMECMQQGPGRWLIIFSPLLPGKPAPTLTPITDALREVQKIPERPKRNVREFLKGMTKPWHGYYVDEKK